ncbi:IE-1 [Urbanus proteus nucleopolyhedrovirus]|uniref:IE-1 n=1 Tax=Urbanus proteus nucleopolyhedrovirus TaxID=1675866 RepID=A0A161C6U8_9ABAC|nr:IE-1 [Urbanus proteus nucleopolyhedrovirus]AKR17282.1 IE-1 [Urbanus proteus nucleopolyhedrovirus]
MAKTVTDDRIDQNVSSTQKINKTKNTRPANETSDDAMHNNSDALSYVPITNHHPSEYKIMQYSTPKNQHYDQNETLAALCSLTPSKNDFVELNQNEIQTSSSDSLFEMTESNNEEAAAAVDTLTDLIQRKRSLSPSMAMSEETIEMIIDNDIINYGHAATGQPADEINAPTTSKKSRINPPADCNNQIAYSNAATTTIMENLNYNAIPNSNLEDQRFLNFVRTACSDLIIVHLSEDNKYAVLYAGYMYNYRKEYQKKYSFIDNCVFTLILDNVRFVISRKLLVKFNFTIPTCNDFDESTINTTGTTNFMEIKDLVFMRQVTNFFNLDMCCVHTKIVLLLAALGQSKAHCVMNRVNTMLIDSLLFSLPFSHNNRHETLNDCVEEYNTKNAYIRDIIKYSKNCNFKTIKSAKFDLNKQMQDYIKITSSNQLKVKKNNFVYKYRNVGFLLFDEMLPKNQDLLNIKNDNNCSNLILDYLNACETDNDNFLLVNYKRDERLTIFKKKTEFYWINNIRKSITCIDYIKRFKKHTHHVFDLNSIAKRDVAVKHNALIKLLSFFVCDAITFEQCKEFSMKHFKCKCETFYFS